MNAQGKPRHDRCNRRQNHWQVLGLVAVGVTIAQSGSAQSIFPEAGSYSIAPTQINLPTQQFVVYVPNPQQLERVRTVAPDAFVSRLGSGQAVVQIGRFNNENLARRRLEQMRSQGIAALMTAVGSQSPTPVAAATLPRSVSVEPLPGVPGPTSSIPVTPIPVTRNATIEIGREPLRPVEPQPVPIPSPNTVEPVAAPPPVRRDRYFAIVPGGSAELLQKARTIAAQARVAASPMGTYIELQGFPDRFSADSLVRTARLQGLDARVIFF